MTQKEKQIYVNEYKYICEYCGKYFKFPVAHNCTDGFRKHKLSFTEREVK